MLQCVANLTRCRSAITRVLDLLRQPGRSQIIAVGHLYNDTYQTLRLGPNRFLGVDRPKRPWRRGGDRA